MEENKELIREEAEAAEAVDTEIPLDKNIKLMSPTRMVLRRFFRSKLSVVGLVMLIALFVFSFLGPVVYNKYEEHDPDDSIQQEISVPKEVESDYGDFMQIKITDLGTNIKAAPSGEHLLGTDDNGEDVFTRLMYGGQRSLSVSFMAVFLTAVLGIVLGGIAGFYGGVIDNIIMRICDMLMCLPTLPILLILGTILDAWGWSTHPAYIYGLMAFLSLFSWPGMARLVRGQLLYLREQEYMVAAEAMGYSTPRRIFKHLLPNVLPQILVSMTMSLGSMILYESTLAYLNLGGPVTDASWGGMIQVITQNPVSFLSEYPYIWLPPGICIVIAVLGFNFVGDGLRDALDPKQRR